MVRDVQSGGPGMETPAGGPPARRPRVFDRSRPLHTVHAEVETTQKSFGVAPAPSRGAEACVVAPRDAPRDVPVRW